jgi:hypothetical protein
MSIQGTIIDNVRLVAVTIEIAAACNTNIDV